MVKLASTTFIITMTILSITKGQLEVWIEPTTPKLPRGDALMAVGHYNGTIYIIGGQKHGFQLTEFDISTKKFTDIGENVIGDDIWDYGQFYSQINEILYMIHPDGDKLSIYNMQNKIFTKYWMDVDIPTRLESRSRACLTSTKDYLFIVGGATVSGESGISSNQHLDTFQVLNISSQTWITGTPSMNQRRGHHSCLVHPSTNRFYAIGGYDGYDVGWLKSIESISVLGDIRVNDWKYNPYPLLTASGYAAAVSVDDTIWIIGGFYYDSSITEHYLDSTQIIDAVSGYVSNGASLQYQVDGAATIMVENVIYSFGGGKNNGPHINKWQYYQMPTVSPTFNPTHSPTFNPSDSPTFNPSHSPTFNPSYSASTTQVTTVSSTSTALQQSNSSDGETIYIPFVIIIICIILVFILIIICLYIKFNMKIKQINIELKQINLEIREKYQVNDEKKLDVHEVNEQTKEVPDNSVDSNINDDENVHLMDQNEIYMNEGNQEEQFLVFSRRD